MNELNVALHNTAKAPYDTHRNGAIGDRINSALQLTSVTRRDRLIGYQDCK